MRGTSDCGAKDGNTMRHSGLISWFAAMLVSGGATLDARPAPEMQGWTTFGEVAGLQVEYPAGIFRVNAGPTEKGEGRIFRSEDGRYQFSAYSLDNPERDSPRAYLRKNLMVPPESLIYRRVTEQFFVMSSIRQGRIFYSRCNFGSRIHCIYLEYPQDEKLAFDPIVMRVSYSLRPR
jgi:hypothetical protein